MNIPKPIDHDEQVRKGKHKPVSIHQDSAVEKFIRANFVYRTPPGGSSSGYQDQLVHVPTDNPISKDQVPQICSRAGFHKQTARTVWKNVAKSLDHVVGYMYAPNEPRIFRKSDCLYLNKWTRPELTFSGIHITERPTLWQEYLDRTCPIKEEQDFLEKFLVAATVRPEIYIPFAVLLRSEEGTGKDFIWEHIVQPFSGKANAPKHSLKEIFSNYSGTIPFSTAVLVSEMYDSRKKTSDALKPLLTGREMYVNPKYLGQFMMDTNINWVITSNDHNPIYLTEGDRRYWIPQFITHRESKDETASWFLNTFKPYLLEQGGQQEIRDYFEYLGQSLSDQDFITPPMTPAKKELLEETAEADLTSEATEFLHQRKHDFKFLLTTLRDERFPKIGKSQLKKILEECGYILTRVRFPDNSRGRFWVHRNIERGAADLKTWTRKTEANFEPLSSPSTDDPDSDDLLEWAHRLVPQLKAAAIEDQRVQKFLQSAFFNLDRDPRGFE